MVALPLKVDRRNLPIPDSLVQHDSLITAWDRICRVHTMHTSAHAKRGLLIFGKSGEGKSHLAKTYASLFPAKKTPEKTIKPVFYYRFREAKKSTDDILKLLIIALGTTPPKGRTEPGELDEQFTRLVQSMEIELLILDEIQQILPKSDCLTAFNTLKYFCALLDELNISIVFVGSERAMKLLTLGQADKVAEDNEQLSRRMLRPVMMNGMEPCTQQWLDCVNWFLSQINVCPLSKKDADLLNRIFIAFTERSFSTLESLFLTEDMSNINNTTQLKHKLKENFYVYGKGDINPFDSKMLSSEEVKSTIDIYFRTTETGGIQC
jgi:energy-coupling factor transporter ATP-binding protein EcfA2